jgi:hypothetical protein
VKLLAGRRRAASEKPRNTRKERASHRGHRGGIGIGAKLLAGTRQPAREEQAQREEHRTEVTEVTEGELEVGG